MPSASSDLAAEHDECLFLADGGEMGERFRSHDWARTKLGPPASWPQSLKVLANVMLGSHQPMFVAWGPSRNMLYNDGYSKLMGKRHPEALGKPFTEVWYDIMEDVGPILDRAFAGQPTHMDDIAFVMERNGYKEEAHFSFSYTPVRDSSGQVAGMFCVCEETTEQVLAEQRRHDETEQLRRLFDHAPGLMAVLRGPEHVFEMVNRSYLKLVGHRDIIGKPVREALPEVAGQGFIELLDEIRRTREAYVGRGVSVALERGNGLEERLVDFVYQPIVSPSGEVTGIFAEGYDVTERHKAEEALRESEERFRLIADSAPVPMWVTKLDRKRSFVNRAYVEFLGINYEEAIDFDWRTVLHPDDADRIVAESIAGEASLKPFALEARYRSKNGEWRWIRSVSQPRWGPGGEHAGFIGIAHDVTEAKVAEQTLREVNETLERRVEERTADLTAALDRLQSEMAERHRAEEALRQAQKMEAVGQLTGGIAHDFNNLLTPIMGGLEILASRMEEPRLKRIAETALEASRRGTKLTSQLLAFSRIQRINMTSVGINGVIDNMEELLRHAIGSGIGIETKLNPEAGHAICDANQLENAILNLAINARDAMPEGGELTISTSRETVRDDPELQDGEYVRVMVTDTGEGMTPEIRSRALEPFFSTKPLGRGTGLGLAQVYGLAQQAGGTIRIESEVGRGTSVIILLPGSSDENPGAKATTPQPEVVEAPEGGATVLVVDDDSDVRSFLSDSLDNLGYKVEAAENGEDALKLLTECVPNLVLLDYLMPGMNGAEVAREIRGRHPHLPIVFVTGYAESEQLEAVLGPNFPMLRKPFTIAQLGNVVEEFLRASAP
jgi:PAS domain S-box-containing protein